MAGDPVGAGDLLARRYRLLARTGGGGMSAVWRAVDERLAREVAVKLPDPQLSPDHADQLRKEARASARIDHPAAVGVFDFGEVVTAAGRVVPYTVMPLLSGQPLAARLTTGPLPWREAVQVAARVAGVLAAAHEQGIVHQDVSAENVHLTRHGAVLLDFGLASSAGEATGAARSRGTPPYVAPERLAGSAPDPASDVYAWGVLLFEALTGHRPFPGTTWEELDQVRRDGPPPRPGNVSGLPPAVAQLCQRSLAAAPEERPSAAEAELALSAVAGRPRHRRRVAVVAAAAAALAAGAAAVVVLSGDPAGHPGADPPAGASGSPTASPPASPAPGSPRGVPVVPSPAPPLPEPGLQEALDRLRGALSRGEESGAIRADVSVDLEQLVQRLAVAAAGDGDTELRAVVAELERKLDDRLREGAITPQAADGLRGDLATVAAAADSRD